MARKAIIEFEGILWVRSDTLKNFDIAMGSSDLAEITNLICAYLLKCLNSEIPETQDSLYRDGVLFIIPCNNKSVIERMRKRIQNFFKGLNLDITFVYSTQIQHSILTPEYTNPIENQKLQSV